MSSVVSATIVLGLLIHQLVGLEFSSNNATWKLSILSHKGKRSMKVEVDCPADRWCGLGFNSQPFMLGADVFTFGHHPGVDLPEADCTKLRQCGSAPNKCGNGACGGRRLAASPFTPYAHDLQLELPTSVGGGFRGKTWVRAIGKELPDIIVGVAMNSVLLVAEHRDQDGMTWEFDECGGHGDMKGHYHYHLPPRCLLQQLGGTVPGSSDWWSVSGAEAWPHNGRDVQVGWALDGAPIYGPYRGGRRVDPADLDECHGAFHATGEYRYYVTLTPPYLPPCLRGKTGRVSGYSAKHPQPCGLQRADLATSQLQLQASVATEAVKTFRGTGCPGHAMFKGMHGGHPFGQRALAYRSLKAMTCGPRTCGPRSCGPNGCGGCGGECPITCGPGRCGPKRCGPRSCGPKTCGPKSCGPNSCGSPNRTSAMNSTCGPKSCGPMSCGSPNQTDAAKNTCGPTCGGCGPKTCGGCGPKTCGGCGPHTCGGCGPKTCGGCGPKTCGGCGPKTCGGGCGPKANASSRTNGSNGTACGPKTCGGCGPKTCGGCGPKTCGGCGPKTCGGCGPQTCGGCGPKTCGGCGPRTCSGCGPKTGGCGADLSSAFCLNNLTTWHADGTAISLSQCNLGARSITIDKKQDLKDVSYELVNGRMKATAYRALNTCDSTDYVLNATAPYYVIMTVGGGAGAAGSSLSVAYHGSSATQSLVCLSTLTSQLECRSGSGGNWIYMSPSQAASMSARSTSTTAAPIFSTTAAAATPIFSTATSGAGNFAFVLVMIGMVLTKHL